MMDSGATCAHQHSDCAHMPWLGHAHHLAPGYMPGKTAAQNMHARHYVISAQVTCASCTGSSGNREGSGRCQDLRRRPLEAHTLPLQVLAAGIRQQLEVRQQHAMSGKCETFKGSGSPRAAAPAPAPLRGCRGCFCGAWASASSSSTEAMGSRDAGPARRSRERSRGGRARYRWWVIVKPAGSPLRAHCCVSLEFSRGRAGSGSRPPLVPPGRSPGVPGPSLGSVSR